jgi:hypothetical protein
LITTISLTTINLDDLKLLEQFRIERLHSFFAQSLSHCIIHRDHYKTLMVHCSEASIVDAVLSDLEELCDYACLILGVESIAQYFAQEEIYRTEICQYSGQNLSRF